MEREGLYPPAIRLEADTIFTVTLRNTVAYHPETLHWLAQFKALELNGNQKRILVYAKEHGGAFTSREYQKLVGVDIYAASRDIKDMINRGLVKLRRKGGRVYELISAAAVGTTAEKPSEYAALEPVLKAQGYVKNEDIRRVMGVSVKQATRLAARLVATGWLRAVGSFKSRRYVKTV